MTKASDTRSSEAEAYMLYPNDGLADLYVGLMIMLFGLFLWVEMPWMPAIFVAAFIPLWPSLKKSIVEPRLDQLDWSSGETERQRLVLGGLVIVGLVVMAVGMLFAFLLSRSGLPVWLDSFLSDYTLIVIGAVGALVWSAVGALSGVNRFYAYGGLTLLAFYVVNQTALSLPLGIAALGAIIMVVGGAVLIRFLIKYPVRHS